MSYYYLLLSLHNVACIVLHCEEGPELDSVTGAVNLHLCMKEETGNIFVGVVLVQVDYVVQNPPLPLFHEWVEIL